MKASSPIVLPPRTNSWRPGQVGVVVLVVLVLGIVLGYLFRNSSLSGSVAGASSAGQLASSDPQGSAGAAVGPLLERLQSSPKNPDLLQSIGNAYYDNHDYNRAVAYYQRYLELRPEDVNVRTDMGTAIWYSGNPDGAIQQYETALRDQPDYPNTLFNMGIVRWQGKHDGRAAIECWRRLLKVHQDYPDRQKVEDLIHKVQDEPVEKLIQKVQAGPNP